MRRLKMVIYFLILGILSSLLGNVSFAWASTQDKLTITEIYDLDLVSAPLICPVGSDSFDEIIQAYSDCPLYAICENENESTELIPSYDTRSVDVQKEGIYEMTMTLQYDKEMFQLSENYSETYTIPVCISDPEKFEIFPTFTSFHHTTLSFLHHFKDFSTIEGAYVKSKTVLTKSQLNSADWISITSSESFNPTPDGVTLSSAFFEEDGYLYVKLTNESLPPIFFVWSRRALSFVQNQLRETVTAAIFLPKTRLKSLHRYRHRTAGRLQTTHLRQNRLPRQQL